MLAGRNDPDVASTWIACIVWGLRTGRPGAILRFQGTAAEQMQKNGDREPVPFGVTGRND